MRSSLLGGGALGAGPSLVGNPSWTWRELSSGRSVELGHGVAPRLHNQLQAEDSRAIG